MSCRYLGRCLRGMMQLASGPAHIPIRTASTSAQSRTSETLDQPTLPLLHRARERPPGDTPTSGAIWSWCVTWPPEPRADDVTCIHAASGLHDHPRSFNERRAGAPLCPSLSAKASGYYPVSVSASTAHVGPSPSVRRTGPSAPGPALGSAPPPLTSRARSTTAIRPGADATSDEQPACNAGLQLRRPG
jgi:hypothetical protein